PQWFDLRFQNVRHAAATDDQEAGLGYLSVNASGGLQEFPLAFATRQRIAADHGKGVVFGAEAPLAPLRFNLRTVKRAKPVRVNAAVYNVNLRAVAHQGRTAAPFRFRRVGFVGAFAQYFGHKLRHRDEGIAL